MYHILSMQMFFFFPEGKSEDKMTEILQIADDVRALVDESGKKFADVCLNLGNGCFNSGRAPGPVLPTFDAMTWKSVHNSMAMETHGVESLPNMALNLLLGRY